MEQEKKENPKEKSRLHSRNKHRERYDFKLLKKACPELVSFVVINQFGDETVDFFNPDAVKMLNTALLKEHYSINNWTIPAGYLCPPIPGRADYLHHIADFLRSKNFGKIPQGKKINVLDIGVGANCIYPIIGAVEYDWHFVGSDIDSKAIENANEILNENPQLNENIELRFQESEKTIFKGIIAFDEKFDLTICNPPFHTSAQEAQSGTARKLKNLQAENKRELVLNFGGRSNELWCDGGELAFIKRMIIQSKKYANSCYWFTTLVSKESNLKNIYRELENVNTFEVVTLPMGQGNKTSRVIAWTFLDAQEQIAWKKARWI